MVGCEKFRYAFGTDEMLMNAEAGLYFEFDEENGIPKNCEGLENFNMDNWINDNGSKLIQTLMVLVQGGAQPSIFSDGCFSLNIEC